MKTTAKMMGLMGMAMATLAVGCSGATPEEDASSSEGAVGGGGMTSGYTNLLSGGNCKVIESSSDEDDGDGWATSNCGGQGGYEFIAHEGDLRQIALIHTSSGEHYLGMPPSMAGWQRLGDRAEWRGTFASPGVVNPKALIYRVFDDSEGAGNRSTLVVAKLTADNVCVYAEVDGTKSGANQKARDEADRVDSIECPAATPRPHAPKACGVMDPNTGLERDTALTSCDGRFSLVMQTDGNLVLYKSGGRVLWQSRTAGSQGQAFFMRPNGEAALYGSTWNTIWSSSSAPDSPEAGARLHLQDDGNLVIYAPSGRVLWASNTRG